MHGSESHKCSPTLYLTIYILYKDFLFLEIKNIIVLNRAFLKLHYMLKHLKALSTYYNYDSEIFKDNTIGN